MYLADKLAEKEQKDKLDKYSEKVEEIEFPIG